MYRPVCAIDPTTPKPAANAIDRLPSPGPTDTPTHQRHGWERARRRRWGEGLLPAASKRKSRRAGFFPAGGDGSRKMAGKNPALHLPPKRGLQQPLEEMLRLAQGLPLLGAQAFVADKHISKFLLPFQRRLYQSDILQTRL